MKQMLFVLGVLCSALLAACGGSESSQSLVEALPLDDTRPTFVFFYTDG